MQSNKIINNAKWIIVCKVVQSLLQLIIGMISARYLGPTNYGQINYAASVVAFVVPVMQLGFRSTLVQELVEHPDTDGEVMGSALVMNLISGAACIVGVNLFVYMTSPNEPITLLVCSLYSVSLLCQAVEMIQYWFQYKLLSKFPSLVMVGSYLVVSAYKIFLLITGKSVYWFALSNSIDYGIIGVTLLVIYYKIGTKRLSFSWKTAKEMLSRGKYYIVSSMMVTVFSNTDHIMLKMMCGDAENGFYSAAITSAGMATFVYYAIVDSARPSILIARKENKEKFEHHMSRLYSIIIYMALVQSLVFTILAPLIIRVLYGGDYSASVPILQILVWYLAFSYMGTVRNVWILAEDKKNVLWRINLFGALANIALNALFIPLWGGWGAAFASLLTQIFTNFTLGFILKPIRKNNTLLIRGLNPRLLAEQIRLFLKSH